MDFMVVLGSDDGLIASGERTFISGSLRPGRCVRCKLWCARASWFPITLGRSTIS